MSPDPYSASVRKLFANPEHAGQVNGGVESYAEDQGVRVRLTLAVVGDRIASLHFLAWGCPHLLAACEAACASFEGHPTTELDHFSVSGLMQSLAVPVEKTGRILVLEDAIRSLGKSVRAIPT